MRSHGGLLGNSHRLCYGRTGGSCQRCPQLDNCRDPSAPDTPRVGGNNHGNDGCACYKDNQAGGCALVDQACYINDVGGPLPAV